MHIKKNSENVGYTVYILAGFSQICFSTILMQNVSSEQYSVKQPHVVTPFWPSSTLNFSVTETSFFREKKHTLRSRNGDHINHVLTWLRRAYDHWLLQKQRLLVISAWYNMWHQAAHCITATTTEKMLLKILQYQTHECAESLKFTSWKIQYTLGRKYDWCPLSRLFIRQTHFANFDINC